jgi:hypothetical protein
MVAWIRLKLFWKKPELVGNPSEVGVDLLFLGGGQF